MAFDSQGRMFVSSDASGEIYVVVRDEASNGTAARNSSPGSSGGKTSGADRLGSSVGALVFAALAICMIT